jgi:hypothetical protein
MVLLLLGACSPEIIRGFRKETVSMLSKEAFYPFFPAVDSTQWFNMQIDFRKNHFSGMLLIKSTGKDIYRTVFTTHFGMSVFDFEFSKEAFRVNYCLEALNKKRLLQTLENDFHILLFLNPEMDDNGSVIYKNKTDSALEVDKAGKYYYLKNNDSQELLKIEAPRFINSLHYLFSDYQNRFPAVIQIRHSHIGLKMQLEKMEPALHGLSDGI